MPNLEFEGLQVYDDRHAQSRMAAIRRILAFSGIHDVECVYKVDEDFNGDLSDWGDSSGSWSISGGALSATGDGSSTWYKTRYSEEVGVSLVATFDKTGDRGGFIVGCDDSYNGWLAWWSGSYVGVSDLSAGSETALCQLPCTETGAAKVTVMAWPRSYSDVDSREDLTIAIWFDRKLLLAHTVDYEERGEKIGFAVYGDDSITYDNLQIPQLHTVQEWASVDPGEKASGGFGRVVGQDLVRAQARYDGSVRVWRNTGTDVDWIVPGHRYTRKQTSRKIYTPSHFRLVGAKHEIDNLRTGNQGHIFRVGRDPNALMESDTYDQAVLRHRAVEERGRTVRLLLPPNVMLEPEDVIKVDGEKWRVTNITFNINLQGSPQPVAVLSSEISGRECL
jgi:hypothetical protein